jgi:holo-[acyl-carrier-protein] synthase
VKVDDEGVVANAFELVEVDEAERLLSSTRADAAEVPPFSAGELAYARSKSDPGRRLAARLAAKRAAVRALGGDVRVEDIEVSRGAYGPPVLRLHPRAEGRLHALGGARTLVSLTHERRHAAAAVLLLREDA